MTDQRTRGEKLIDEADLALAQGHTLKALRQMGLAMSALSIAVEHLDGHPTATSETHRGVIAEIDGLMDRLLQEGA